MSYLADYFSDLNKISGRLDLSSIELMVKKLRTLRERGGRLFILGVGGSAANASHAVNDFRKLCHIESYSPMDNVSEISARTNDEGWETVFSEWLKISKLNEKDGILIFSVGGGSKEKNISPNLIRAIDYAKERKTLILGIVGRDGGYTAKSADVCCLVPTVNEKTVTPHSEAFQAVIWHALVSHPDLKVADGKWESVTSGKK